VYGWSGRSSGASEPPDLLTPHFLAPRPTYTWGVDGEGGASPRFRTGAYDQHSESLG
jgi:hypothetical protein